MEKQNKLCGHLSRSDVRILMLRIASLPEEQCWHLTDALIIYTLLNENSECYEQIPVAYNKLTRKQKSVFMVTFDEYREVARGNGFLVKYDSIRRKMETNAERTWRLILLYAVFACGSYLFIFNDYKSLVPKLVGIIFFVFYLSKELDLKIKSYLQETLLLSDFIRSCNNKQRVVKNIEWATQVLREAGLIDDNGRRKEKEGDDTFNFYV
ncbi:MAG: hypothetical protein ABH827_03040 [bacterium]